MLDEPKQPKKRKRSNSTFRTKAKVEEVVERLPLDLEADSPKLRALKQAERRRKGFRTAAMILLTISLLALGRAAVNETLLHNPRFTLQEIKVDTHGMLSSGQIETACGIDKGINLLTVNLSDVREHIMQMPAVRSASVQRDFNGRLTVTAQQRQPIAWVRCETLGWIPKHPMHSLLVDEENIAIPAEVVVSDFNNLPVINDSSIEQITPGRPITSARFLSCTKLLKEMQTREQRDGIKLTTINAHGRFALDAVFDNGSTVIFAYDDLDPQLQRYDRFVAEARQKKWSVQSVNLVATHNVPVTFNITKSASSLPAAIPVVSQVADASPTTRAARASAGKSTRKSSSH